MAARMTSNRGECGGPTHENLSFVSCHQVMPFGQVIVAYSPSYLGLHAGAPKTVQYVDRARLSDDNRGEHQPRARCESKTAPALTWGLGLSFIAHILGQVEIQNKGVEKSRRGGTYSPQVGSTQRCCWASSKSRLVCVLPGCAYAGYYK